MCNDAMAVLLCLCGCSVVHCCHHLPPTTLICVQMSGSEPLMMCLMHSKTLRVLVRVTTLPSRAMSWQGSEGCKGRRVDWLLHLLWQEVHFLLGVMVYIGVSNIASAERALLHCSMW